MTTIARLATLALLSAGVARAADGPCANDAARFCPGKGGYLLRRCLYSAVASLTPSCRVQVQQIAYVEAHQAQFDQACGSDAAAHCRSIQPGVVGPLLACLRTNGPKLAPTCQAVLQSVTAAGQGLDPAAAKASAPEPAPGEAVRPAAAPPEASPRQGADR